MAMSIRGRTREVAVLKTLGFTRQRVLSLFVGEAVAMSVVGGCARGSGGGGADPVADALSARDWNSEQYEGHGADHAGIAMLVAATVGFISGCLPAYNASRMNIVEGLRHIG